MNLQLILDASTPTTQVGILHNDQWLAFEQSLETPTTSLHACIQSCLKTACITLQDVQTLIYCEGPGSTLGVRLCQTMAQSLLSAAAGLTLSLRYYTSLQLAGAAFYHTIGRPDQSFSIVAPAPNKEWYHFSQSSAHSHGTLAIHPSIHTAHYYLPVRKTTHIPATLQPWDYNLKSSAALFNQPNLCTNQAVLHAVTHYKTWLG